MKNLEEYIGFEKTVETVVDASMTAIAMKSGEVDVYATPYMIALMEYTATECVRELLDEGYCTVGVAVNVEHLAATPVGMKVKCRARLCAVEGRMLTFEVEAFDAAELIGKGTHRRCVVNTQRFLDKAMSKNV